MATGKRRKRHWAVRYRFPEQPVFIYASAYRWSWIGVQRDFAMDGTTINLFGIGVFIGDEFWWRLRHRLKRRHG